MVYDEILAYLSGEYRKGKTYQQIADEHGLSFGYIRDLIHGRNKVERMSLETFFQTVSLRSNLPQWFRPGCARFWRFAPARTRVART